MERYTEEAYIVANIINPPYFQILFLSVNVDDPDLSTI